MNELIETRPYIKTSFVSDFNEKITVLRINQTTGKIFAVVMMFSVWQDFQKKRNETILQLAGLNKEQILFISQNILKGEKPHEKVKKTYKRNNSFMKKTSKKFEKYKLKNK